MSRIEVSNVEVGTGLITVKIVDTFLKIDRGEACKLARDLIWAIHASAEETDVRNTRMKLKTNNLYREVE